MKEIISITELLNRIKSQKRKVDDISKRYLDSEESRALISLYNKNRNETINGANIIDTENNIKNQFSDIIYNIMLLRNLLIIKEQVNSYFRITVPDIFNSDKEIELSIAQILILKSPIIKNYYIKIGERLRSDLNDAYKALEAYSRTVLDEQKIATYVLAKLNSIQPGYVDPNNIELVKKMTGYNEYAKEYIDANKVELLDPLELTKLAEEKYNNINNFYDNIDTRLLEFNSTTKIIIDLESGYGEWEKA